MEHRFYTLDVFTNNRFEGNPLAVFTDGDGLSDDQMLVIARGNESFGDRLCAKADGRGSPRPAAHLHDKRRTQLAGHPVIGTWFLLAELGVVPAQDGGVRVSKRLAQASCRWKSASRMPPAARDHDSERSDLQARENQQEQACPPHLEFSPKISTPKLQPEFVSTGIFNLMVPLRNRAALGKIAMNMSELRRLQGKNATMAYCFALGGNGKAFFPRHAAMGTL